MRCRPDGLMHCTWRWRGVGTNEGAASTIDADIRFSSVRWRCGMRTTQPKLIVNALPGALRRDAAALAEWPVQRRDMPPKNTDYRPLQRPTDLQQTLLTKIKKPSQLTSERFMSAGKTNRRRYGKNLLDAAHIQRCAGFLLNLFH